MVGRRALDAKIGVRIPASEQFYFRRKKARILSGRDAQFAKKKRPDAGLICWLKIRKF